MLIGLGVNLGYICSRRVPGKTRRDERFNQGEIALSAAYQSVYKIAHVPIISK